MKKLLIFLMMLGMAVLWAAAGSAFVRYEDKHPQKVREINITGFGDYAPFGYIERSEETKYEKFVTVFQPMIDTLAQENNLRIKYKLYEQNYPAQVQKVRQGDIDIALGAYHQTELFRGLELIFPAAFVNPITVMMLPNRIDEVKTIGDLRKLKGVRTSREQYSDFVEKQLKSFEIETVDNSYDLFERLFTQKADYIVIGQYYGLIEASKLGLRNQISTAKQALWQVPMFVAVSKLSRERKMLSQKLTRYLENEQNQKLLRQNLIRMVDEAEINAQGIVPPTFGLEKSR